MTSTSCLTPVCIVRASALLLLGLSTFCKPAIGEPVEAPTNMIEAANGFLESLMPVDALGVFHGE